MNYYLCKFPREPEHIIMKQSAGILIYRIKSNQTEFFLVHPGGPFWAKKDEGAWTIPKGEFSENENPFEAAKRELEEETGIVLKGNLIELAPIKQKNGKIVHAWATELDVDNRSIKSNTFSIEWPPKSGKMKEFPEVDRAEWFSPEVAKKKINPAQAALIIELLKKIK